MQILMQLLAIIRCPTRGPTRLWQQSTFLQLPRLRFHWELGSIQRFWCKEHPPTLVNGLLPILNISVTLLTLRAVLGSGAVTLAAKVALNAGDVIGLFYAANGLTITLNLGIGTTNGIVWSVHELT